MCVVGLTHIHVHWTYIKTDVEELLFLSEGVCCQLNIIQYHPDVAMQPLTETQTAASATTAEASNESTDGPVDNAVVQSL